MTNQNASFGLHILSAAQAVYKPGVAVAGIRVESTVVLVTCSQESLSFLNVLLLRAHRQTDRLTYTHMY